MDGIPDNKVHVAHMGPMKLAVKGGSIVSDGMLNLGICVITFSILIQIMWVWCIIDGKLNITLQVIC